MALIFLVAIAVAGVVVYDTMIKKPLYQANTTVVIAKSDDGAGTAATLNDINASQKLATTYGEISSPFKIGTQSYCVSCGKIRKKEGQSVFCNDCKN